jgi:type II secretory pathway pseudopilin PulG
MLVIGILAAIAIPLFLGQKDKAYETSMKVDLTHIETAVATIQVDVPSTVTVAGAVGTLTVSGGSRTESVQLTSGNALHDQSGNFAGDGWCVSLENPSTTAIWNITSLNGTQRLLRGPCT